MTKRRLFNSLFSSVISFTLILTTVLQAAPQERRKIEEDDDDPKQRAAIAVTVDQVRLDVTVRDKKGNLITGLSKDAFEIYEDKVAQEIVNFAPVDGPITAVLMVEYNKFIGFLIFEALEASYRFLRTMRKGDWIAVMAYDIRPEILVDFTQDPNEVINGLRRLNTPAFRESNFYDATFDVLDRLQEVEGRTALIVVATGLDTFSKKNLSQSLERVKRANTVIYPIALGGNLRARRELPTNMRMDFYQADSTLKEYAKATGGEAFYPRFASQYPAIYESISNLLRNQYSISYISSNPRKDGKYRKIRIKVKADTNGDGKPDKLKLNHRSGYYAEKG